GTSWPNSRIPPLDCRAPWSRTSTLGARSRRQLRQVPPECFFRSRQVDGFPVTRTAGHSRGPVDLDQVPLRVVEVEGERHCAKKLGKGGRDSNSETFRWNPAGNQSRPAELGQQPEASLAWWRGDPPCEA